MAILLVFFAKNLEVFALTPKFIKKTLLCSKELFFCQNDPQRSKKAISKNIPKNLCKSQNLTKRVLEHQELWWNLTPGYVIFNLGKAAKSFRAISQSFLLRIWKSQKIVSFLQNCFFFKMFHSCQFFCRKSKTFLALTPKIN